MNQPAIEFCDVKLHLGGSIIYDSLDFDVATGEFVGLLGPSGCGKSSALRLIGDLLERHGGVIRVEGLSPKDAWDKLAYVFQAPRLLPWKSTLDNAALGLEMRKPEMTVAARRQRANDELSRVGLAADVHKMPAMLPDGERQRVAIALALDPAIVLMDEPFPDLILRAVA